MTAVPSLSQRLAQATRTLHRRAESSGIMPALLRGQLGRDTYGLLLRNLQALYAALESALDRNALSPWVAPVRMPVLYRSQALRDDLVTLAGAGWQALPLAPSMHRYVEHLALQSPARPQLLAAHAYVRYMGDLSGGQVLRSVVARSLDLPEGVGTAFYDFPAVTDLAAAKAQFRSALDHLPVDAAGASAMVDEAIDGFARHVELFEELSAATQGAAGG